MQEKYELIKEGTELLLTKLRKKQRNVQWYNLRRIYKVNSLRLRLHETMLRKEEMKIRMKLIEEMSNPLTREWTFVGSQYSEF